MGLKEKYNTEEKKTTDKKRVLLVTLTPYDRFLRVRRLAKTLSKAGVEVHILSTMEKKENRIDENDENINLFYIPIIKRKDNLLAYILLYSIFFIFVFIYGTYLHLKYRYGSIYVVNHPDILVLCLIIPRLLGTRIILDIRDPMPEIFASKFGYNRIFDFFLRSVEKIPAKTATRIMTTSNVFKSIISKRDGVEKNRIFVIYNTPYKDFKEWEFKPRKENNAINVIYIGAIRRDRGIENLIFSLNHLENRFHLILVGDGDYLNEIKKMSKEYGNRVTVTGRVPHDEVKKYLFAGDVFVVQMKSSPINYIGTPGKIFEYIAYEKPVLVPRFRGVVEILGEDYPFFFNPDNPKDIAVSIKNAFNTFYSDEEFRANLIERYRNIFYSLCWNSQEKRILDLFFGK